MRFPAILLCAFVYASLASAQGYPPYGQPQGAGLPVPGWLRGTKTITGHIAGIDPDRQHPEKILVRTMEAGNVLVIVDNQTKVHVEKNPLSLSDLREGDAVAVKIKEVKGKGPYATEIMPHPDVWRRKEKGGEVDAPPAATELPATPLPDEPRPARRAQVIGEAPVPAPRAVTAASEAQLSVPALPRGSKGLQGTIVGITSDEAQLQMESGEKRAVLVTSVTRIAQSANRDLVLDEVRVGDKVAVMGDSLDSGIYVAREILVNRAKDAPAMSAAAAPTAIPAAEATPAAPAEKLSGDFTGVIESISGEDLMIKMANGRTRKLVVLPSATIKKWNADLPLQALRKGDELKVTGDVLEDGSTLAREITVTKPAGSR